MAVFPIYAKVLRPGFSEEADYGVLRTEMDGGIAKQRARWSKPKVTRDVVVRVNNISSKLLFDEWVRSDISGGAGWFSWVDNRDGVTKQARIVNGKITWASPGSIWLGQCQIETIG